jgi:hypothetical protein
MRGRMSLHLDVVKVMHIISFRDVQSRRRMGAPSNESPRATHDRLGDSIAAIRSQDYLPRASSLRRVPVVVGVSRFEK